MSMTHQVLFKCPVESAIFTDERLYLEHLKRHIAAGPLKTNYVVISDQPVLEDSDQPVLEEAASWGTSYTPWFSYTVPKKQEDEIEKGGLYTSEFEVSFLGIELPLWLAQKIVEAWRTLSDWISGTETLYVYVKGKYAQCQWRVKGSPVAIATIIALFIVLVIVIGLIILFQTIRQIITIVPPEYQGLVVAVGVGAVAIVAVGYTYSQIR